MLSYEPQGVVKFFEKLRFIINQFEPSPEKYDYVCLTAFILLKQINLHTFMLKEYSRNFRYIDLNDENRLDTKIFPDNLKNYIKTSSKSRYVGALYTERDSSVIKFLIMINVVRCHCDANRLYNIASHFMFSMNEKVQQDVDKIIEIIKILN